MKTMIIAALAAAAAIGFAPLAQAAQSDVLCSSNIAYRNAVAHKTECADIAIGSHGGGGGMSDENGNGVDDRLETPAP